MITSPATISYYTNQTLTGQVNITKLDQIKFFISGTFSFTAIDQNGDKVQVTDGRFDAVYRN